MLYHALTRTVQIDEWWAAKIDQHLRGATQTCLFFELAYCGQPMAFPCLHMAAGQSIEAVNERISRTRPLLHHQLRYSVVAEPRAPNKNEPVPLSISVYELA